MGDERYARSDAQRALRKANRQLLLAAELTFDRERGERLAALAHRLGEGSPAELDAGALAGIADELESLREGTHPDVRDAIVRAQELLSSCREVPPNRAERE